MAIDIGADAINREQNFGYGVTYVDMNNPANESGIITAIEIYSGSNLSDCKVGTFSRDGANFTCRDYEVIDSVELDGMHVFPVSITCVAGDYIGIYFSFGNVDQDVTGYAGVYKKDGDQFEAGEQTYSLSSDDAISVYGTSSYALVEYYFNFKSTTVWTDAAKMIDNILTNYAYTSGNGDTEVLDGNTGPGTDLGTITKVEIGAYAYGDGNDRIDLIPVFSGGDGDEHQTTPGLSPGSWGAYQDITNDTNHPSSWAWSDVQALDCQIIKVSVAKANVMYCAKVEIKVTYTPTVGGVAGSHGYIF